MKKWKLLFLFLVVLSLLGSGCGIDTKGTQSKKNAKENSYWIYEINNTETDLTKKKYEPKDDSTEEMLKELESAIAVKDDEKAVINLLSEDVTLLNHVLAGNVLTLNFNDGYKELSVVREILVRAALVKTFIQVPGISAIQIQVDGKPLTDSKEQEIGMMTANSFMEGFNENNESYRYASMVLYFASEDGSELIPEERNVYYMGNLPLERVILEQLMKGPTEENHYKTLSPQVELLSVVKSDGDCYINFSDSFISDALAIHPEITIYSVVNSIVENCNVQRVQISVGGESDQTFREIMDLNRFYEKNEQLIHKGKEETEKK